ncbi:MAG: hypothetical protein QOJ69_1271 [Actinomycetota bacterium]|jgi:hypothetical protein|nr:hypothetical protein [Actinomycetota bacterium]MEA2843600.1 hypothetical protein [Actinomycetota bacterium]
MTYVRKGDGYGGQQAGPTGGGGAYASNPTPKKDREPRRPAATYGAPAAATAYYGDGAVERKRFPWWILVILCVLAVLFVIGICKWGIKDTTPIVAPKPYVTTTSVPAPIVVSYPLARAG